MSNNDVNGYCNMIMQREERRDEGTKRGGTGVTGTGTGRGRGETADKEKNKESQRGGKDLRNGRRGIKGKIRR